MKYDEIVAAAKAYADRQDIEVSDNVDVFILMAESRVNRVLKTMEQTHRIYTKTIDGQEFYSLPDEYNGMRSISFNVGEVDASTVVTLSFVTPEAMIEMQASCKDHDKYYYTVVNSQLQLHKPLPGDGTIEMVFYRKVPNLNKVASENWLAADHPDIYLAGLICEIESFAKNYDVAKVWDAKMSRSIEELRSVDIENRWSGNILTVRAG